MKSTHSIVIARSEARTTWQSIQYYMYHSDLVVKFELILSRMKYLRRDEAVPRPIFGTCRRVRCRETNPYGTIIKPICHIPQRADYRSAPTQTKQKVAQ